MTEYQRIYRNLWRYFYKYEFQLENSYVFDWESDFFCVSRSGYAYELEVKVSRSDFFADFKKQEKHRILQAEKPFVQRGYKQYNSYLESNSRTYKKWFTGKDFGETRKHLRTNIKIIFPNLCRPHKFVYVVPKGLIEKDEVPEYAGLMYSGNTLRYIKQPPFLHKDKIEKLNETLLYKFYWAYRKIKERQRYENT